MLVSWLDSGQRQEYSRAVEAGATGVWTWGGVSLDDSGVKIKWMKMSAPGGLLPLSSCQAQFLQVSSREETSLGRSLGHHVWNASPNTPK